MMKFVWWAAFVLIGMCCPVSHSWGQAGPGRKQLFDGDWKFVTGEIPGAEKREFDDRQWRAVDLPHDWSIEGEFSASNPMGNDGGYLPAGIGWYRKTFTLPSSCKGKKVGLYFEGVYMNAEVFVNGKPAGIHPYGYTSFYYDITPWIDYGKANVVAVRVDNAGQKNCRWYSGSGIYRHVWLTVTDAVHIDHWGVVVVTPEVGGEQATVQVKTKLANETDRVQHLDLITQLSPKDKNKAVETRTRVELPPAGTKEIVQEMVLERPRLWSTETPHLYTARVEVRRDGKEIDCTNTTFGIRSLQYSPEKGLLLNGRKIVLNGGCVHHDNGCLGAAAYDRAEYRKVELLKAAGFNAVRTSHNPPSEAFLDACDRLGLLVMDEAFDGWRQSKTRYDYASVFDACWQQDISSMVMRDRNHPSIFCWSIGNEIIERKAPEAIETARKLAALVKHLDPTRPVTSAMTTWDNDWEIFDPLFAVHDIGGYNYQLHRAPADHQRVPGRMVIQTESYPRDAFANWALVDDHEYIFGDFVWTAMDYLGESGIGRYFYAGQTEGQHYERDQYPWHGAYCGDIDLTGWRKPISYYREILYRPERRKLYLAVKEPDSYYGTVRETMWSVWPTWERWDWDGHEGKEIQVEIYSRYPAVKLYLNDKLIGEKPTGREQEFKAVFTLPYEPGVLKAVGMEEGKEVESTMLATAGEPVKIGLKADRTRLTADGQDLAYVIVTLKDKDGNAVTDADRRFSFEVEGAGLIAGVDNADLKDTDPYRIQERNSWNGRAMVVIKSKRQPGKIILKAKAGGVPQATLILRADR